MDFTLSPEQQILSETLTGLLAEHCTGADLRRMLDRNLPRDEGRWRLLTEMGLPSLMAPTAAGGAGLDEVDMAIIAQACGYAALPEPLVEHAGVAVPMLAETSSGWLPRAIAGEAVAARQPGRDLIACADGAAALLLDHGDEVHLLPVERARLTRVASFDPLRRLFAVEWQPSAETLLVDAGPGQGLWARAFERGALLAAAQLVGMAQRAVDVSVAYARERSQFGKPIGAFQAVKHALATAQIKIEFARPVVLAAAAALAGQSEIAPVRVSHAKLAAAAAADLAAHTAVQVHGAMGYSWEVDVHFLLKRALALSSDWGEAAWHRRRIAAHVLSAELGPDRTFGAPFQAEAHDAAA